jgi:uncharacterized protein (DUF1330 family)
VTDAKNRPLLPQGAHAAGETVAGETRRWVIMSRVGRCGRPDEGGTMAKGYVIFMEHIRDEAGMVAYGQKVGGSMSEAGGKVLAIDKHPEVLEGEWHGTQTVVLEFESVDKARAWYQSSTYQAAIPLRQAAADANVAIVAGFEAPVG